MIGLFRSRTGTLAAVTLLFVAGIGGWIFMERNAQAMLWNRTQAKADEISQAYIDTIRDSLPLLRAEAATNAVQLAGIRKLEDVAAEVASQPELPVVTKLQNVTRMQMAIASVLSAADIRQMAEGPFHDLQQAVGDRGALSEAIQEYNQLAREWNQRSASFLGSVAADVSDLQEVQLPYLRVDGLDEALLISI